jgi:excisionase family DNA binding protein
LLERSVSSSATAAVLGESLFDVLRDLVHDEVEAQLQPRRFLSKEALADHLGVSPRTIKTWRSRGLPGCRVGREVMFDIDEVNRWIERHA